MLSIRHSCIYLLLSQFLFCFGIVFGADINDLQLGTHRGYTLLVLTCDQEVSFNVKQDGTLISIEFPEGTGISIHGSELDRLKNEFVKRISYDKAGARILIEVNKNYELRVYRNRRPFQLVMDFAHLAGKPTEPVSKDIQHQPTHSAETPPAQEHQVEDDLPKEHYSRGIALREKGDYEEALEEFRAAIPNRGKAARYQMALMYEELNQREAAIHELVGIINEAPSWIEPKIKLGLLYQLSGRSKRAETVWYQILEVIRVDSNYDYNAMKEQISVLESMLDEDYAKISDNPPPIDFSKFPRLPWNLILLVFGIGALVLIIRLITNWRLNRMIASVLGEEFDEETSVEPMREIPELAATIPDEPVELVSESVQLSEEMPYDSGEDAVADAKEDIPEPEPAKSDDILDDERQQMIYKLAQQNYTIAEIAKMLNMGQEEVKFILDFRSRSEDVSK
ncbi:MAG: hypothetical protein HQ591_07430 [candidate division Zixibacteria bacterium]|nr:hypothetical protein [Candidatus Tariuqbacter arcticus]